MDVDRFRDQPALLISRTALLHNVAVMRRCVRAEAKICAMIKADAYGHGAALVADALCNFANDQQESPAVDAMAVTTIEEAEALPAVTVPVLIFQPVENAFLGQQRSRIEQAIRAGWTLTLSSKSAADDLARIATSLGKRAAVQIMIDTGLARSGIGSSRASELIERVQSKAALKLSGLCTHFAASSSPDPFTTEQLLRFESASEALSGKASRHAANSAAVFFAPESHLDMVRPGISVYGIDPTGRPDMNRPLRPVMKWTAPLVGIRDIPKGTGVGYDHTWTAERDSRIGLVPVGYADGYLRCFSNRGWVLVQGKAAPVIGRVSMDVTTIDLTNIPAATIGDTVTLLDDDPLSLASVYRLAAWANTIPYEIFCRIGPRVKRIGVDPIDEPQRQAVDAQ